MLFRSDPNGEHLGIEGLEVYDVAHVTRFFHHHKELMSVMQVLKNASLPAHEIKKKVPHLNFRHLPALEFLGYISRAGNIFMITNIGKRFLLDPMKPLVLSNAVKEKMLLDEALGVDTVEEEEKQEEMKEDDLEEEVEEAEVEESEEVSETAEENSEEEEAVQEKSDEEVKKTVSEKYDLDKLTELLGGK